ncbi:MAG: hypothetical protein GY765_03290 [bacterium]|nr:hypothetical protein [bacterium]
MDTKVFNRRRKAFDSFALVLFVLFSMFALALFQTAAELPVQTEQESKLKYTTGVCYSYDWSLNLKTTSFSKQHDAVKGDTLDKKDDDAKMSGLVEITPLSLEKDGSWFLKMTLLKVKIQHTDETGQLVTESDADLDKEFSRPVYFYQQPNGEVSKFMVHAKEEASTANLKRGIVSSFHTRIDASASKYSGTETDVSGAFTANYAKVDEKGLLTVTKTRTQNDFTTFVDAGLKGEDKNTIEILDTYKVALDTADGIFKTLTFDGKIVTANEEDRNAKSEEGTGIWSEIVSNASLTLLSKVSVKTAETDVSEYNETSLMAVPFDDGAADELTEKDIAGAVDELRGAPLNPDNYESLLAALKANASAVSYVRTLIVNGGLSADVMGPVIGALGSLGTAEAQAVLAGDILSTPGTAKMARSQALVALGLVKNPTEETIGTLENISRDKSLAEHSQAVLALGAAAKNLAVLNGQRAASLVSGLEQELARAYEGSEVIDYLQALGNAGFNSSLKAIAPYLGEESVDIRNAAEEAQARMTSTLSADAAVDPADISTNRELSRDLFRVRYIGSGNCMGRLDGSFHVDDTNGSMIARCEAGAKARVWGYYTDLMRGKAETNLVYHNGQIRRRFNASLKKGGTTLYSHTHYLNCNEECNGSLYSHTMTFFTFTRHFYPYGLRVAVTVRGSGTISGTYEMGYEICNEPVNSRARVKVTPYGYVTAYGSASASFFFVRVGVTTRADVLKTRIPCRVIGVKQTAYPYLRGHFYLRIEQQPLSRLLYTWRIRRCWCHPWGHISFRVIYNYTTPSFYHTFINRWSPF